MYLDITREDITSELLGKFIHDDFNSEFKETMRTAEKYAMVENEQITNRRKMMVLVDEKENQFAKEDLSKSNIKIRHSYLNELVTQCTNYLAGKPLRIDYKEGFDRVEDGDDTQIKHDQELIEDELYQHNNFTNFIQRAVTNTQLYGVAYMRIVKDEHGNKFIHYDPKEIIMFYNDFDEPILAIRYFSKMELIEGEVIEVNYAEVFDEKYKDTWVKESGAYEKKDEDEPVYAEYTEYGNGEVKVNVKEYGLFPIIEWRFNDERIPTITHIKDFIDIQDLNFSDLANDVSDIQDAIWILENYQGQNLKDFMDDLNLRKAVKVGDGGDVRSETIQIPLEARNRLYEISTKNIYKYGFGIDFSDRDSLGNVTGVALKWSYAPLEQKANSIENNGQNALNQFFNILFELMGLDYDSNDLDFLFDRSMIANEQEITQMVMSASPKLSDKTVLDVLPMVTDTEEELERLENEKDQYPEIPEEFEESGNPFEDDDEEDDSEDDEKDEDDIDGDSTE